MYMCMAQKGKQWKGMSASWNIDARSPPFELVILEMGALENRCSHLGVSKYNLDTS